MNKKISCIGAEGRCASYPWLKNIKVLLYWETRRFSTVQNLSTVGEHLSNSKYTPSRYSPVYKNMSTKYNLTHHRTILTTHSSFFSKIKGPCRSRLALSSFCL